MGAVNSGRRDWMVVAECWLKLAWSAVRLAAAFKALLS